ncbi:MAG: hypothetical protein HONDAALG_04035 [Gammaproteobacteria bacterium]|nr:hypothetical protein [Gammaproteobacteria bacterium]
MTAGPYVKKGKKWSDSVARAAVSLQSSGRRHSHTATHAMNAGTAICKANGSAETAITVALATIIAVAVHFARLGTAP